LFLSTLTFAKSLDPADYLKNRVVEKKLKNGITVLMLDRGYSPTLSFEISFRVGSVDESYETIGTAHFLEHMLFKGTDRLGTKDFKKEKKFLQKIEAVGNTIDTLKIKNSKNILIPQLEKKLKQLQKEHSKYVVSSPYDMFYTKNGGIHFNASTSKDKTGYYISLPSSKLDLWAQIESERLRKPIFREFYLERGNVQEERLMRYDSQGSGLLYEAFNSLAFDSHPYRHPTIGWKSNIPFLSISNLRKFYFENYTPNRMTITIVGKQNTDNTYKIVKRYFGKIKSRPDKTRIAITERMNRGEKRVVVPFKSSSSLILGWHKPTYKTKGDNFKNKEDFVFDLLSEILSAGKTSRFYRSLVLKQKLASSVQSWNGSPGARYNNMFTVFASPRKGVSNQKLEKAIYNEIYKVLDNLTQEELDLATNRMESDQLFSLSDNRGIASTLSYYQTVFKDWHYVSRYVETMKTIKIEDIKNVIKKYCVEDNRVVAYLKDTRKGSSK